MAQTMKMYFDVPDKRCTICIESEVGSVIKEQMTENVSSMMGAPARYIEKSEFTKLSKQYVNK